MTAYLYSFILFRLYIIKYEKCHRTYELIPRTTTETVTAARPTNWTYLGNGYKWWRIPWYLKCTSRQESLRSQDMRKKNKQRIIWTNTTV